MSFKNRITESFQKIEHTVADKAGRTINQYSLRQRKLGLVVFGLVAGTFCFLLVMGTLGDDSRDAFPTDTITTPKRVHPISLDSLHTMPERVIDSVKSIIRRVYHDKLN